MTFIKLEEKSECLICSKETNEYKSINVIDFDVFGNPIIGIGDYVPMHENCYTPEETKITLCDFLVVLFFTTSIGLGLTVIFKIISKW